MRWMVALVLVFGCTKPAPPIVATPAPTPAAVGDAPDSAVPDSAVAAPPASASAPPLDGLGGLLAPWPPALLARLTRVADAIPKGTLDLAPPPDAERDQAIRATFGNNCRLERTCGPLWGIDCQAAVDGPYEYVRPRADHLERITTCGGACMGGRCTNCPPRDQGWTCKTY